MSEDMDYQLKNLPGYILANIDEEDPEEVDEAWEAWTDADPEHRALCEFLKCSLDDVTEEGNGEWSHGRYRSTVRYLVLDDDDADEKWEEYLRSYIDECLEIPESIRPYFDEEAWIRDAKGDGRACCLATYDGEEREERDPLDDDSFFIYRVS